MDDGSCSHGADAAIFSDNVGRVMTKLSRSGIKTISSIHTEVIGLQLAFWWIQLYGDGKCADTPLKEP